MKQENVQLGMGGEFAQTFRDYVADTLTARAFEELHTALNITKTRLTQVFNDPLSADEAILRAFAGVLKVQPYKLLKDWGLAKSRISAETAESIKQESISKCKAIVSTTPTGTNQAE